MTTYIVVKTTFEATHHWPECPIEEVAFLRHPHRHIFHTTVKWLVSHTDRDKEFIVQKRLLEDYITQAYARRFLGRKSCEDICMEILTTFPDAAFVSVHEDNENGAEVHNE